MADWRKRQKEALRQELYAAALDLFNDQGFDDTSVQQITSRVGVAKGTFFNHFPSKEHVLEQWYHGITFDCLETARARPWQGVEDAVVSLFADMAGRAAEHPELLAAKARHGGHPLLVQAEKVQDDEIDAYMLDCCRRGQAAGELRSDLDLDFFVGAVGAMLTGTSREWVARDPRFDFAAVVHDRTRFLFRAARAADSDS